MAKSAKQTAFEDELKAQLRVLVPQIRGLADMVNDQTSPELKAVLQAELTNREQRRDLIQATLQSMDALTADLYPALLPVQIQPALLTELQSEVADAEAASGVFTVQLVSLFDVEFGEPIEKV